MNRRDKRVRQRIQLNRSAEAVRRTVTTAGIAAGCVLLLGGSCRKNADLPEPASAKYGDAVRAFFVGLAALEAGDNNRAETELTAATRFAPGEPAAWADLGIVELRSQRMDEAAKNLQRARDLAPTDSAIVFLNSLTKSRKGDFAGAAADCKKAVELDPKNLRARYAVVDQVQQMGGPTADTDVRTMLQQIDKDHADNLVIQLELARIASKLGDGKALKDLVARLGSDNSAWPPSAKEQFMSLQAAAGGTDPKSAITSVLYLNNVLKQFPKYRSDYSALNVPAGEVGRPIERLLKLPNPPSTPALPDNEMRFVESPSVGSGAPSGGVTYAEAVYLSADSKPVIVSLAGAVLFVGGSSVPLAFPAGASPAELPAHPIAAADLNGDFKTDLAVAGAGGLRLYQQGSNSSFMDVTAKAKLPASITAGAYRGVWVADVDMDGDLDLVISPINGPPGVLRNNGDGTFKAIQPFSGVKNIVDFGWADLDNDGDPDAIMLDSSGRLHVFTNERSGQFKEAGLPSGFDSVAAFAVLDSDDDGLLDVVALKQNGSLSRLSWDLAAEGWKTAEIGQWAGSATLNPGSTRLLTADLDNNGAFDLIASSASSAVPPTSAVWLQGANGAFSPLPAPAAGRVLSIADVNGDGRLDLVGVSADKKLVELVNQGKKNYAWQDIRPQAVHANGDQRINSFGIGGDIEVRAGFLTQRQPIASPVIHFGLGTNAGIDAARIFWPNGLMQAEFALKPNAAVTAVQRLKGSCPWVFAWDGKKMAFVTDFLWRSPLGLKINAQDTGRVAMTEDWVRIPGSVLTPRDGRYDIRITAELWETHFFDYVSLMTVDHPAGTEMFVDERFAIPPPKLGVTITGPAHPVAHAIDDRGTDVTAVVRELDGLYLDTFGRGRYQGVTRDHYVEVDLGPGAPDSGKLWLIAQGWIHPTDSSINVAMAQGNNPKPRDLALEVMDGKGGWVTAKPHLGFPAGKNKTILIDLTQVFHPGLPKRFRLRTNLEVYWDRIAWASGADSVETRTSRSLPSTAELRYRGFSSVRQANASSPELPDYQRIEGASPRWCDLVGYYTRFGDVRELLRSVDDRYVIMNAGDEMYFQFPVQSAPPAGWVRDFVLIGDGWEKDGDLNTGFSKTVLPLPAHSDPAYSTPPTTLEKDPVYRRRPQDWQSYQTRYVTPEPYWSALRPKIMP